MSRAILRSILFALMLPFIFAAHLHGACSVTSAGFNFGEYFFSDDPHDTTGQITVSCNEDVPSVSIAAGVSSHTGQFDKRKMKHTTANEYISYNLYGYNYYLIWGDGKYPGTLTLTGPVTKGLPANFTVCGRIYGNQDPLIGTYTDTLVVTVTW